MTPTLTVLVPAYNEAGAIGRTIDSLTAQEVAPERILVVDDGSSDGTGDIARAHGAEVITPPANLGSKAKAQNYGLEHVDTDLVLPVDADTVLAPDYVALIKEPFADESVTIAAGCVLTQKQETVWERGRQMEYLSGFHWFRPVQHWYNAPLVCSGCCSAFRVDDLRDFGGFPERTLVEDIDYTWSQQITGKRAAYVADAVAYAAEPETAHFMRVQLRRWKHGYFQNVRQHYLPMIRRKPMLALWVSLSLLEILLSPLLLVLLAVALVTGLDPAQMGAWWAVSEALVFGPALAYAVVKRKLRPWAVLKCWPAFYVLKVFNFWYDLRGIAKELIAVPLGWTRSSLIYEKGH